MGWNWTQEKFEFLCAKKNLSCTANSASALSERTVGYGNYPFEI